MAEFRFRTKNINFNDIAKEDLFLKNGSRDTFTPTDSRISWETLEVRFNGMSLSKDSDYVIENGVIRTLTVYRSGFGITLKYFINI